MKRQRPDPLRSFQDLGPLRPALPSAPSAPSVPVPARPRLPAAPARAPAVPRTVASAPVIAADAQQLFAEAVADVAPQRAEALVPRHRRPRRSGGVRPADASRPRDESPPPFHERAVVDLGLGDEAIEGLAQGIDRRWLRRLRRGELAVESRLDLHGATRQEAQPRLEQFVLESRRRGLRCVLIVHGRGLHSPGGVPVLKEQLKTWLLQGPLAPCTMAFCGARASDGGAGAIYLLLRR